MRGNFVFSIGDGRRVRFWEDRWCGDDTLSRSFPSLFELTASKEEWVAEVWVVSEEEGVGILTFLGRLMIERWRRWRDGFQKIKNVEDSCPPKIVGFDVR